nr:prephenate dehydratase [bacterium]
MDLSDYRRQIDEIDGQLIPLFTKRMQVAGQVADYKAAHGLTTLHPGREQQVLERVSAAAGEAFAPYARMLYAAMFEASRAYQNQRMAGGNAPDQAGEYTPEPLPQPDCVAVCGVQGAYAQQAAGALFPQAAPLYAASFEEVFLAVEQGRADIGVVPIENSLHGTVEGIYDLLAAHPLSIVRAIRMPIRHALLAPPGAGLEGIRQVYSHPQALGQCSAWFKAHPGVQAVACTNTAAAALKIAQIGHSDAAAIASPACAGLYGLAVLSQDIQNMPHNYTRFIALSRRRIQTPDADKISLRLTLQHQPGALSAVLSRFASLGLNLTRLESRPIPGANFEFYFYLDVQASLQDARVRGLMNAQALGAREVVLLGHYREETPCASAD